MALWCVDFNFARLKGEMAMFEIPNRACRCAAAALACLMQLRPSDPIPPDWDAVFG